MKRHSWLKGLAVFLLVFFSFKAYAASLYIDPAFGSLSRGDSVTLAVRLDTDEAAEECINAVDGVIHYDEGIIPVDVSTGDSIFSMWVEQPKIDTTTRTITFAGGIPNGYCGRVPGDPRLTNTLVQLIFRSPGLSVGMGSGSTTAKVEFAPETTAYLNDGFGTKADLAMYGTRLDLSGTPGPTLKDPWQEAVVTDDVPPAQFGIELQRIPLDTGDWHIVFNTVDKQTGVDQYLVIEEPTSQLASFNWGRADAPWVEARSPHRLDDQSLNSIIRVKAVDKAGNEYIATLLPDENLRTVAASMMILYAGIALIGLLVLMLLGVGIRAIYLRHKKNKLAADTDSNVDLLTKAKEHDSSKK